MIHAPLERLEGDRLVTYSVGADESVATALAEAFRVIDPAFDDRETVVHDWVDGTDLDRLCRTSNRPLRILTTVWNHPVVVTPDEVRIYAEGSGWADDRRNC